MRVSARSIIVPALCIAAPGLANAEPYILDLSGRNYSTSEAQAIGQELEIVGLLTPGQPNPPFQLPGISDWSTEYTLHANGLMLADPPNQPVKNYSAGTIELWSQAPPNAPYTPSTPPASVPAYDSADVPSTFIDGTLLLRGNFTTFTTIFYTGDTGSISSVIEWVAGSKLAELQAQNIEDNWHLNGYFNVSAPVPAGYQRLYGGKLERAQPVAVEPTTWGRIKDLWRGE